MFEVKSGVPIPPVMTVRQYTSKYPLRTMSPGDSFFVAAGDKDIAKVQRAIASAAARQQVKVSTRKVVEEGIAGIRVWRTG